MVTKASSNTLLIAAFVAGAGLVSSPAGSVSLSDTPLFLSAAVDPNVFFEIDDSGSMDWEITTSGYWDYRAYIHATQGTWQTHGIWLAYPGNGYAARDFGYVYRNADNHYGNGCRTTFSVMYACGVNSATNPSYAADWRVLSSDFNVIYYNPQTTYEPWDGPCDSSGNRCTDANFNAARSNPYAGEAGYTLTKDLDGFTYDVWEDTRGYPAGGRPHGGASVNATATPNGEVDLWDKHTTYRVVGTTLQRTEITYNPQPTGLNRTATALPAMASTDQVCHGNGVCRTVADELQNIANWYQYHRKRSYVTKAALGSVVNNNPDFRYGMSLINNYTQLFVQVPPSTATSYTTHNNNMLKSLFAYNWDDVGTPLIAGLNRTGRYFDNTLGSSYADPIVNTCQKNFAILFTDGYYGDTGSVGNIDGDPYRNTLADVAKYYYDRDLSDFPNDVAPDPDGFDTATHQHMVTFTVAFGVEGLLTDTDGDGWPNPALSEASNWGDPATNPGKIDDLWHAAWNSKGQFISAKHPGAVASGLQEALQVITNRAKTSSSVALSSGHIQTDTRLFQAQFVGTDWHGKLLAIPVASGGVLGGSTADAGQLLPAPNDRVILTRNSDTNTGVAFRWNNLSATQQAALNQDLGGTVDGLGEERLDYLRGDDTNEDDATGFRERSQSKLGDIINSAPTYVGAPMFRYPDDWGTGEPESCGSCGYSSFKADNQDRTAMVYVGANDGMLHGFKAEGSIDTGLMEELIAYVPESVYPRLTNLTAPNYAHKYYVDGTPTIVDAFWGSSWHTVLTMGLNKGGQGVFAMDVTDPASFTEANAASLALWEFTDADDPDMGYTFSQPAVIRMHNGVWAAVFGNGYNNTDNDGHASTTGRAVLYIVRIDNGALIKKIDTRAGTTANPNGLGTPAPVDVNGDYIVDYIYAGDLLGNVWKFDVTSSNPTQWASAFGSAANPAPLYTATGPGNVRQPITGRPTVGRGPFGTDLMVYFGTGRYLGNPDISDTSQQTFYAIVDRGETVSGRNNLVEQSITFTSGGYGVVSDNAIDETDDGWYIDYPDTGERTLGNPILRGGRIIFVTVVPDSNSCSEGGVGYLWELGATNGGQLSAPPFDINGDGVFDEADMLDVDGDGDKDAPPQRKRSTEGVIPAPAILMDEDKEYKYNPGSSGNIETTVENPGEGNIGRQSWRQIK